jgi:dTDP-4-dehydrorhamnose reductase
VFDGKKEGFYTEDDRPDPQSVYARSKYEGELRSSAVNPDSIIVRSGWIYGHAGTNFLSILPELVSERRTFKAIDDVFGTPTFADDLAVRLRELAAAEASGIFHATNYGDGTSYYGFACTVEKILGTEVQMTERVSEKDLDRPAARPRNSRLKSIRSEKYDLGPLRDWKEALNAFLKEKGGFKPPHP